MMTSYYYFKLLHLGGVSLLWPRRDLLLMCFNPFLFVPLYLRQEVVTSLQYYIVPLNKNTPIRHLSPWQKSDTHISQFDLCLGENSNFGVEGLHSKSKDHPLKSLGRIRRGKSALVHGQNQVKMTQKGFFPDLHSYIVNQIRKTISYRCQYPSIIKVSMTK